MLVRTSPSPLTMSAPLFIANAFTTDAYGGNPAALVLVDEFPESQTMGKIAANLNQPMTAFLRPTSTIASDAASASYDVRWHTPTKEVPICGHATLASSGILFSEPSLLPSSVASITYRTAQGAELTARKDGDWVEITLPATAMHPPSPDEEEKIKAVLCKALGEDAQIAYIGIGGAGFEHYMMVEVDEEYNLGGRDVNFEALVSFSRSISLSEPQITTSPFSGSWLRRYSLTLSPQNLRRLA